MVMPLWDDNPFTKPVKPWVTWGIIALNIVVFFIEVGGTRETTESIIKDYALTPVAITHPVSFLAMLPTHVTLVTHMFLHADIFHLFGNMIFLFVFGDDIEEAMGALRFAIFYLACGVIGALVFIATSPESAETLVGASGAISGVIAAYLMLRPCAKIKILLFLVVTRLDAFWLIGTWVILQVLQLASKPDDDVAYWGHVGGMLAGAVLFPPMRRSGVELFECLEPWEELIGKQVMPDSSGLPGRPREPTVR